MGRGLYFSLISIRSGNSVSSWSIWINSRDGPNPTHTLINYPTRDNSLTNHPTQRGNIVNKCRTLFKWSYTLYKPYIRTPCPKFNLTYLTQSCNCCWHATNKITIQKLTKFQKIYSQFTIFSELFFPYKNYDFILTDKCPNFELGVRT